MVLQPLRGSSGTSCPPPVAAAVQAQEARCPPCEEPKEFSRRRLAAALDDSGVDGALLEGTGWADVVNVPRIEAQLRVSPYIPASGQKIGPKRPEQALLLRAKGRPEQGWPNAGGNATLDEMLAPCEEVNIVVPPSAPGKCLLVSPAARPNMASYHVLRHMRKEVLKRLSYDAKHAKTVPPKSFAAPTGEGHDFELVSRFVDDGFYNGIAGGGNLRQHQGEFSDMHVARIFANMKSLEAELGPILEKITAHMQGDDHYYSEVTRKQWQRRNWYRDQIGKSVVSMTVNPGAVHMLANFLCSAKANGIDIRNVIVFVTHQEIVPVVEAMGVHAFWHESLGSYPKEEDKAAFDRTFAQMMLMKSLAAYLPLRLGYDVLFQDADLVWMRDPWEYFRRDLNVDAYFMDDGNRFVSGFGPFWANTGFYYWRYNPPNLVMAKNIFKNVETLAITRSHQIVVNQELVEASSKMGVNVEITPLHLFPSGQQYSRNTTFMKAIRDRKADPFVFHMNWTKNSTDKVKHFRELNHWYMNDDVLDFYANDIVDGLEAGRITWQDACVAGHA